MDDIQQMREYVALVELRSFTAVAKRFFLNQSTVSKRLKRMEDELGVTLIERGSKSVAPTEEGMLAYQAFKDIIARYDALEASLDVLNRERTGILSIGVLYHGVDELTAPFVSEFKKVCPNVKVRYVPCQNYQVAERLASEEIDVGFAGIALEGGEAVAFAPDARFSYIPIRKQVERCAVSPKSLLAKLDVVDVADLADHTFLCVSDEGMGPEMAKELFGCERFIDAGQVDMVPMMLSENPDAFTISDDLIEKRFGHMISFRPLSKPIIRASYCFVRRKDDANPLVALFEKTIHELG